MEDIGQFLFLLAFVIIAVIQWVIKQVQKRNAPPEEEDPLEDTWRELEDHFDDGHQEQPPAAPQQPPAQQPGGALSELRNLFESLRQPEAEPAPRLQQRPVAAAPVIAKPPPFVPEKPRDPFAGMSVAEKAALKRLQEGKAQAAIRRRRAAAMTGFRQMLGSTDNLRQALILKEVLDRPIALRKETAGEIISG